MLGVSYHTAAKHIKNIYAKLGISSRAQAVQEAIRMGLLN
jgi:DNA-binding CsgD family transcriptional regulator